MAQDIPIFLAVEEASLAAVKGCLTSDFRVVGNSFEISPHPTPEQIVQKAEARGAAAIICEAGSRSPFGVELLKLAKAQKVYAVFIPPSPGNLLRDIQKALEDIVAQVTSAEEGK